MDMQTPASIIPNPPLSAPGTKTTTVVEVTQSKTKPPSVKVTTTVKRPLKKRAAKKVTAKKPKAPKAAKKTAAKKPAKKKATAKKVAKRAKRTGPIVTFERTPALKARLLKLLKKPQSIMDIAKKMKVVKSMAQNYVDGLKAAGVKLDKDKERRGTRGPKALVFSA